VLQPRVIPCLLLRGGALVKTERFERARYIGDPVNAVQIFNEKEVDEIAVLDIAATPAGRPPQLETIEQIACECFIPLTYGGGVASVDEMARIYSIGVEKIAINTQLVEQPALIEAAADRFGTQSIVAAIDARRVGKRYSAFVRSGTARTPFEAHELAARAQQLGAGEILLTSIDRDGTMKGYDVDLVRQVTAAVDVPVVASGGAGSIDDVRNVIHGAGAAAAAIGSMVVYHGRHRAVLISFPTRAELDDLATGAAPRAG
jgi:cyclase